MKSELFGGPVDGLRLEVPAGQTELRLPLLDEAPIRICLPEPEYAYHFETYVWSAERQGFVWVRTG